MSQTMIILHNDSLAEKKRKAFSRQQIQKAWTCKTM